VGDTGARVVGAAVPVTPHHYYRTGDRVAVQSGQLVHLGRIDRQVQINGIRVELDEVEGATRDADGVIDAVAVVVANASKLPVLRVAYTGRRYEPRVLMAHLAERLPPYMIPGRIVWVPEIPLNPNGKTDVPAITAMTDEAR
jgi:acyl-coenzyme A synthetase/AMP-(fatty) acid ligase